ncbi:MAG: transporter [Amycolatopsis sp.]|jgi:EmrB/QacA subfamily drug resistance transporter|uniref:MFS transporter n=1 Tax=Amycolatopsis sp. TaxID=37632 RepID=UPI00261D3282|nr:MFS transporter [Amycolatopsis sp.]MCU1682044.1 transporter [Amycolatopsis sp.]
MSTTRDGAAPAAGTAPAGGGTPATGPGRLLLIVLLGAQFLIALDFSILNVALPDIGTGLGFSLANLQWVVTLFALASAGFSLMFGRVADVVGRRRMFLIGMALLALASLAGGLADSQAVLLAARVAQGLSTAMIAPAAMALLTTSFPEGAMRDRALGLSGALLSAGFTTGAVLGGVLTGLVGWRWAFLINVPVCVAVLVFAPKLITDRGRGRDARLDATGAVTVTAGLLALVYGVTAAGSKGWGSTTTLVSLALAVVLLVVFWLIERRVAQPLVSVRVLMRPSVRWGNIGGLVTFTMFSSVVFLMTLYLQEVLHYSPLVTGLAFGVQGVAAFFAGLNAPKIIARLGGSKQSLVAGLVLQAASTAALFLIGDSRVSLVLVIIATSIGGFAHVLSVVSFMVTATSGLPDSEQGLATGLATLTQQAGITLGIPIMSAIAAAHANSLKSGSSASGAVLGGTTFAIVIDAAVVLAGAVVVGLFLRKPAAV